jgi:hypothetical protein
MSDEEKSIEEIIAELEGLEKEAKEGESTQAVQKDDDAPVELTMEEPRDDIQRMETPSATGVAQDGPEEYADIFAEEKTPGEASADIEIEELSEEITLTDSMDDKPAQPPSSDDSLTDEIILEEPLEGLSLDEPGKVQATETEGPAAIGLHDSDGPAQKEAGEMELFLESDEISLEEVTPERVEVDATAEMSARSVGDEISLEETTVDEGEDDAAVDEPSFGDAVEPVLDRPPQLAEEDKALFDDQTMRFAPEERDAAPAHGDSSGAPFDKRLLSEVHTTMPAGGEPPAEPPDWTEEGFPPDEPPPPPPKGRKPLKMKRSRVALFLGIFLIVVVLYGIFVWPKLYEYRLVKSGDVKYQVKINRITKTSIILMPDRGIGDRFQRQCPRRLAIRST